MFTKFVDNSEVIFEECSIKPEQNYCKIVAGEFFLNKAEGIFSSIILKIEFLRRLDAF